jgi:hypothetical protein
LASFLCALGVALGDRPGSFGVAFGGRPGCRDILRVMVHRLAPLVLVAVAACGAPGLQSSDGRGSRSGGGSVTVRPSGVSAIFLAGDVPPTSFDYAALGAAGKLGCTDPSASSTVSGARAVDAGAVQVMTPRAQTIDVPYASSWGAHSADSLTPLYVPGESVTVRGGGTPHVPPFRLTVAAPTPIALLEPHKGAVVARTHDVKLKWRPEEGFVVIDVVAPKRTLTCTFDAHAGTGVIAKALLSDEPAGELKLKVSGARTTSVDAGTFHTTLTALGSESETHFLLR